MFIGIDPGAKGGVAIISPEGKIEVFDLPISKSGEVDCVALYHVITKEYTPTLVVLEKVGAMPGQGVCSMFSFGRNVGEIKACLKIARAPFQEVLPQAWKKVILAGLPWKNTGDKKRAKSVSCTFVERMFPHAPIKGPKGGSKDGRADAVCLALYAKKLTMGII